jgi:hypothetical protein
MLGAQIVSAMGRTKLCLAKEAKRCTGPHLDTTVTPMAICVTAL